MGTTLFSVYYICTANLPLTSTTRICFYPIIASIKVVKINVSGPFPLKVKRKKKFAELKIYTICGTENIHQVKEKKTVKVRINGPFLF